MYSQSNIITTQTHKALLLKKTGTGNNRRQSQTSEAIKLVERIINKKNSYMCLSAPDGIIVIDFPNYTAIH